MPRSKCLVVLSNDALSYGRVPLAPSCNVVAFPIATRFAALGCVLDPQQALLSCLFMELLRDDLQSIWPLFGSSSPSSVRCYLLRAAPLQ